MGEYDAATGAVINARFVTGPNYTTNLAVVVTEPSTAASLALGAAVLLAWRRRWRLTADIL